MAYIVTKEATRPNGNKTACFYCRQPIGTEHHATCVLIKKKVQVQVTFLREMEVPAHWEKDDMEYHWNDSSWCVNNLFRDIGEHIGGESCMCPFTEIIYMGGESEPFLEE